MVDNLFSVLEIMQAKQLLKFTLHIFILIGLLIIIDISWGLLCSSLLYKQNDGRFYKISYSLDKSNEEIIILGSSRAETNYNPAIFEKELGMSCWNAGRGGQGLLYCIALEEEILKRYSPKIILLNMDPNGLEGEIDYDMAAILRPFSRNHTSIYELLSKKNWSEKYKLLSNIYTYNSMMFYFIRPYFIKNKDGNTSDKGWKPRKGEITPPVISKNTNTTDTLISQELNPKKIILLNQLIENANRTHTKLIISIPPDYLPIQRETATMFYIKNLSINNPISVIDMTIDTSFVRKQKLFRDLNHMNDYGATIFSARLVQIIQQDTFKKLNSAF